MSFLSGEDLIRDDNSTGQVIREGEFRAGPGYVHSDDVSTR